MMYQTLQGRYTIQKRIGMGGFGVVYLAHDRLTDRPCAIKVSLYTGKDEAVLLASLDDPSLPFVYDYFTYDHKQCIVMEHINGRPVHRLNPAAAASYILQVGQALEHMHNKGLLHLDIKPDNIVMAAGKPVLVDFGLAAPMYSIASGYTHGYSAPEQCLSNPLDGTADLYSLAATYYTLLTGVIPQPSIHRLYNDQLKPPSYYVGLTPDLDHAIMQAMSLDPSKRI